MKRQRLEELRAMPYKEYLQTPEWQATRKSALKRAGHKCQICNAGQIQLEVHHRTYENLGCEQESDVIALCEVCHDLFSQYGKLATQVPEEEEKSYPDLPFAHKAMVGIGTASLLTIGIEGILQAPPPAEIGALGLAVFLACKSPAIYGAMKEHLPESVVEWMERRTEQQELRRESGTWSEWDKWMGRHLQAKKPVIRDEPTEEEIEAAIAQLQRDESYEESEPDMLLESDDISRAYTHPAQVTQLDDQDDMRAPTKPAGLFRFSELLATGWRPRWSQIFVGRTMDGDDIFVTAEDLCHVAIAGKTGGGKGSLMRLIMVQLCFIGANVLLLNPHYMKWVVAKEGKTFDEDWTPFEGKHPRTGRPYLQVPPAECAEMVSIEEDLGWAVEKLLEERKREGRAGGVRYRPYFIVLDEWPSIAKKIKGSPEYLATLLREGRKYGVFVFVASQDFQVKTIGMEGGSVRKCLLTTFYTGGDITTAKELLDKPIRDIPETRLGKGVVMLKCVGTDNEPVLVRVPFVDNESVYTLLGPSTFHKATEPQAQASKDPTRIEVTHLAPSTLTFETIKEWFDAGRINDKQFFALVSQLVAEENEPETDDLEDPFDNDLEETKPETVPYVPPPKLLRPTWKYEEYYPVTQEAYRLGYTGKRKLANFIRDHGKSFNVDQVGYGKALEIITEMQGRGMLKEDEQDEEQEHAE